MECVSSKCSILERRDDECSETGRLHRFGSVPALKE